MLIDTEGTHTSLSDLEKMFLRAHSEVTGEQGP